MIKKIETKAEWLKAILNGAKGVSDTTREGDPIIWNGIMYEYLCGGTVNMLYHKSGFGVILEPTKLSDFLKNNNCYDEFVKNFDKESDSTKWKDNTVSVISSAFIWGDVEQGHNYWYDIDTKWRKVEHKENDMLWLIDEPEAKIVKEWYYLSKDDKQKYPKISPHLMTDEEAKEKLGHHLWYKPTEREFKI